MTDFIARLARKLGFPLSADSVDNNFKQHLATIEVPVAAAATMAASDIRQQFIDQAKANLFEVLQGQSPQQLIDFLATQNVPIRCDNSRINNLVGTLAGSNPIELKKTTDYQQPCLGLVIAETAIAETGTLVVSSHNESSALLFLAEILVILVPPDCIMATLDDVWQRESGCAVPRAIHWISGPSRTADIEQTLQVGAHGPRQVYLWITDHSV